MQVFAGSNGVSIGLPEERDHGVDVKSLRRVAVTITKGDGTSIELQVPTHETIRGLKVIVSTREGIPAFKQELFVEHDKWMENSENGALGGAETLADINIACGEPPETPVNIMLWVGEEGGEPEEYSLAPLPEETSAITKLANSDTPHGHGNDAQCVVSPWVSRMQLQCATIAAVFRPSISASNTPPPPPQVIALCPGALITSSTTQWSAADGDGHYWQIGFAGEDGPTTKDQPVQGPM
jgi:hypothetical protein